MKMNWLTDVYTVLAGDVAATWSGRGFNVARGQWETVSGGDLSPSEVRGYRIRAMDFRVTTAGGLRDGVIAQGFIMGDPLNRANIVPWWQGIQSKGRLIQWEGDLPMLAGFVWRIHPGGVVATDVVSIGVVYE